MRSYPGGKKETPFTRHLAERKASCGETGAGGVARSLPAIGRPHSITPVPTGFSSSAAARHSSCSVDGIDGPAMSLQQDCSAGSASDAIAASRGSIAQRHTGTSMTTSVSPTSSPSITYTISEKTTQRELISIIERLQQDLNQRTNSVNAIQRNFTRLSEMLRRNQQAMVELTAELNSYKEREKDNTAEHKVLAAVRAEMDILLEEQRRLKTEHARDAEDHASRVQVLESQVEVASAHVAALEGDCVVLRERLKDLEAARERDRVRVGESRRQALAMVENMRNYVEVKLAGGDSTQANVIGAALVVDIKPATGPCASSPGKVCQGEDDDDETSTVSLKEMEVLCTSIRDMTDRAALQATDMRAKLTQTEAQLHEFQQRWDTEGREARGENKQLQDQLRRTESAYQQLTEECQRCKGENQQLRCEVQQLQGDQEDLKRRHEQLRNQHQSLQEAHTAQQSKHHLKDLEGFIEGEFHARAIIRAACDVNFTSLVAMGEMLRKFASAQRAAQVKAERQVVEQAAAAALAAVQGREPAERELQTRVAQLKVELASVSKDGAHERRARESAEHRAAVLEDTSRRARDEAERVSSMQATQLLCLAEDGARERVRCSEAHARGLQTSQWAHTVLGEACACERRAGMEAANAGRAAQQNLDNMVALTALERAEIVAREALLMSAGSSVVLSVHKQWHLTCFSVSAYATRVSQQLQEKCHAWSQAEGQQRLQLEEAQTAQRAATARAAELLDRTVDLQAEVHRVRDECAAIAREQGDQRQVALASLQRLKAAEEASESTYSCPICFQLYRRPVTCVPCGHTYCVECLVKHIRNKALTAAHKLLPTSSEQAAQGSVPVFGDEKLYCPECGTQSVREVTRTKALEALASKFDYRRQVLQSILNALSS